MASCALHVQEKALQYETFINDVLKSDLEKALEQRDEVYEKISQYLQLENTIESFKIGELIKILHGAGQGTNEKVLLALALNSKELKTEVDIGCNFFVQAHVENMSKLFVAVGFGFFVELTHTEALKFIKRKTTQLTAFTKVLNKDAAKIKANICMVLEGLRELQSMSGVLQRSRS